MSANNIKKRIKELKEASGTHSPSVATMLKEIPEMHIDIDACFLSNPYATDLFIKNMEEDLIKTNRLRDVLEYYPPQNHEVAKSVSTILDISPDNIFVGNGAIEIIQAVIHRFVSKKLCVIIPTFSSYYEFITPDTEIVFYKLDKENDYLINVQDFAEFVKKERPDSVILINPNNPNGGYISFSEIKFLLQEISFVNNIILDESFIHFAYEDTNFEYINNQVLISEYPNLIIIKSMSKDFGIAGLRAGYAIMSPDKVKMILKNGFLWNVSGLADYFFKLYADKEFITAYNEIRKKYIQFTAEFFKDIQSIPGIKVLPSKANFALVEILNGSNSFDFCINLLSDHNVYVRDCSDKIGLSGEYVRIASRTYEENVIISKSIRASL